MVAVFTHLLLGGTGMSVTAFFHGTFHHDAQGVPFIATLAPIFALLLRGFSWWTLFLILPFLSIFRRAAGGEAMRELGYVFLAFLLVGLTNDLLFNQWAKDYSFWSYYLIPAVCLGSAITLQRLHETRFQFRAAAIAVRVGVPALFVICAVLSGRHMIFFVKSHFHQPIAISEMLSERGLKDMLDHESVLLVPPYCREPQPVKDSTLGDSDPAFGCDIYYGAGYLARYTLDKQAIAASDFDASRTRCEDAFVVLKGPRAPAGLGQLAIPATEIPWFQWHVLRLSQLAPDYCKDPARIFADLDRTPAKFDFSR